MFRKVARRVATHEPAPAVLVDTGDVPAWLGRPRFVVDDIEHGDVPGVATGLAVTAAGGDVLVVSLLREESVRAGVAMTAEVTLRGRVLPVAGSARRSWRRTAPGSPTSSCRAGTHRSSTTSPSRSARRCASASSTT